MKVYLIIDETRFYLPDFLAEFLRRTEDDLVGAAVVTSIPKKNSIENYLVKNWYYLTIAEMAKLTCSKYTMAVKDALTGKKTEGPFYSVRSVLDFFKIDVIEVENNINKKQYLDVIRAKEPDVIISSNSLIFRDEILNMSKICCINRHSALLPSYGGLWPVFQAYRSGEKYTGATIHTMEAEIDKGIILAQRKVPIKPSDTISDLYDQCYKESAEALLEAMAKINNGDLSPVPQNNPPSYYSFPAKEHWQDFRTRGGRFI